MQTANAGLRLLPEHVAQIQRDLFEGRDANASLLARRQGLRERDSVALAIQAVGNQDNEECSLWV
jgi:hypothetical protein